MATRSGLTRLLATPENRSALAALRDLLHAVSAGEREQLPNPLFLHGASGTGKTFLVDAVAAELTSAGCSVCRWSGNDFAAMEDPGDARGADLLIVEDLHHLPMRCVGILVKLFDERERIGGPMIFTATQGPGLLQHRGVPLPRRWTSRLAGGLVVALEPMQRATRRRLLQSLADNAKLRAAPEILDWLAEHLIGGGRQLEGAVRQWKALERLRGKPLRLDELRAHLRPQLDAAAPTVKRIAAQVCARFRVPPRQVISTDRSRAVLLPRQVSMYLARQLTPLSLQEIGKYFGGRDHKTVQHACKKVETAMKADAALSGAIRQLRTELQ